MASTIKVDTIDTPDGTGNITVSRPLSGSGASLTSLPAGNLTGTLPAIDGSSLNGVGVGKNIIINGDMRIHQRGGTITMITGNYNLDRFFSYTSTNGTQTAEQSTVAPVGFKNSLKVTTTTADSSITASQRTSIIHRVEGNNISHLDWGTSDAKSVTLSFWVRSSVTGTHGGAVGNGSDNRAYPFTYTISSADTWEKKTITIAGDTTGTWVTTNARSLQIAWGLGVGTTYSGTAGAWESADRNSATGATTGVIGTLNATWYLTGVKLEVGTSATDFEHRSYGEELRNCQRYYYTHTEGGTEKIVGKGAWMNATQFEATVHFKETMRATPTLTIGSGTNYFKIFSSNTNTSFNDIAIHAQQPNATSVYKGGLSGTQGDGGNLVVNNASGYVHFDAEL